MSWIRRSLVVGSLAVCAAGLLTAPAQAAAAPDVYYDPPTPYAYHETFNPGCHTAPFKVKARGEGVNSILNVPGTHGQAFLAGNTYFFHEKWINKKTGKRFTLTGQGQFNELTATRVPTWKVPKDVVPDEGLTGPIYRFTAQEIVKEFTVRRANGSIVKQDRGILAFTQLYDTLGDKAPGGTELSLETTVQEGHFPLLDVDLCQLGARLTR
jgi:hypothetical protein